MRNCKLLLLLIVFLSLTVLAGNAGAELDTITDMKVFETEISMEIGETYTFKPKFSSTGDSGFFNIELHIFSSDDSVVVPVETKDPKELMKLAPEDREKIINETVNTIKAVGGGSATVIMYTNDYQFSQTCTVKVNGPAVGSKAKDVWSGPTAEQMKKVKDPALKAYFTMLAGPEMASAASSLAKQETFKTLISAVPGKAESLAAAAEKIGMEPVYIFEEINMISVQGSAAQYLRMLEEKNLLTIEEDQKSSVSANNITKLGVNAEKIVSVAKARAAGMTGAGTAVVILDTGINPNHEQFTKKKNSGIILQACFSSSYSSDHTYYSCANGTGQDLTSAVVGSQVSYPDDFNHGIHVAGIAAGKDGVASEASIIAINVFSEIWEYTSNGIKHDNTSYTSDQIRAYQYLQGKLGQTGKTLTVNGKSYTVAAINMSLGGGAYSDVCDYNALQTYTKNMWNRGIISVACSHNQGYTGYITQPACISTVFAVGALADSATPTVASFSNHSKLVNNLAPGSNIKSATTGTSNYESWNGTSMATPMVAGSFALLRQAYPRLTADQMKQLMIAISGKSASRAGILKRVLNFNNINKYNDLLAPSFTISGGPGKLQMQVPIGKDNKPTFTIKLYKCAKDRTNCKEVSIPKMTISRQANKSIIRISGLSNFQLYRLNIYGAVTVSGSKYNYNAKVIYAMPMPLISIGTRYKDGIDLNWNENSLYSFHEVFIYNTKNGKRTGAPIHVYRLNDDTYSYGVRVVGLKSKTTYYLKLRHIINLYGRSYKGDFRDYVFTTK